MPMQHVEQHSVTADMLNGIRVLVVEDQPLEAWDYCDRLRDVGAQIIGPYATSHEALSAIASRRVDVAVIDFALADSNSGDVQDDLDRRGIPFVLLTGYPRVLVRRRENQQILSKPVSPELLCMLVKAAWRQGQTGKVPRPAVTHTDPR